MSSENPVTTQSDPFFGLHETFAFSFHASRMALTYF